GGGLRLPGGHAGYIGAGEGRRGGGDEGADGVGADHQVVEGAGLALRGAAVPVVLQEEGVDGVLVPGAVPVEIRAFRFQPAVDAELEGAVPPARGVHADVGLDADPAPRFGGREDWRPALTQAEPAQVLEVVVAGGDLAAVADAGRRVDAERVAVPAPDVRDEA